MLTLPGRTKRTITLCAEGGNSIGTLSYESANVTLSIETSAQAASKLTWWSTRQTCHKRYVGLEVNQTASSRWITMRGFAGIKFKVCQSAVSLALATRLLSGQLPRFLKRPARGSSRGSPAVSPLRLNATHNRAVGEKKNTTYVLHLKQPEDGEAIPLLKGFVSH